MEPGPEVGQNPVPEVWHPAGIWFDGSWLVSAARALHEAKLSGTPSFASTAPALATHAVDGSVAIPENSISAFPVLRQSGRLHRWLVPVLYSRKTAFHRALLHSMLLPH